MMDVKVGTWAAVLSAIIAGLALYFEHFDSRRELRAEDLRKPPPEAPIDPIPPGPPVNGAVLLYDPSATGGSRNGSGRYFAKISQHNDCETQQRLTDSLILRQQTEPDLFRYTFSLEKFKNDPTLCAIMIGQGDIVLVRELAKAWKSEPERFRLWKQPQVIEVDRFVERTSPAPF